jgi:two-component system alkaline phosphatase synthesis response regulator PhoP
MALRALVIDGQPDVRRLIAIKLGQAGFRVSTALDGQEGLARALADKPDVIVLDALTPKRDGYSVAGEVRRQLTDHPPVIIMLSAQGQLADIARGLDSGADDYLVKPFAPRELLERIAVALIKRGRMSELPDTLEFQRTVGNSGRPSPRD